MTTVTYKNKKKSKSNTSIIIEKSGREQQETSKDPLQASSNVLLNNATQKIHEQHTNMSSDEGEDLEEKYTIEELANMLEL
jgi:hypothetical protein